MSHCAASFVLLAVLQFISSAETGGTFSQRAAITSDPSNGSGFIYGAEGSNTFIVWRYYVPAINELSEISLTHNERHAFRYFRIRSNLQHVTNISAVFPPFTNDAFVNDVENMTFGISFRSLNRSVSGNWTLNIVYSNIALPAASNTVTLFVAVPPVNVRVQPSYRYPLVRSYLEINCLAESVGLKSQPGYTGSISFKWFHNGMMLSSDLIPAPKLTDDKIWVSKLVIPSVSEVIAGGYACQAEELGLSTISSTIRITVVGFPVLAQRPYPGVAGESLALSCQPHVPAGLGIECSSLNVRLTCNGRQLHALTFPTTSPLYESSRLGGGSAHHFETTANATSINNHTNSSSSELTTAVDYTFDSATSDLNAADCLCIVKYNRRHLEIDQNNNIVVVKSTETQTEDDNSINTTATTGIATTTMRMTPSQNSELLSSIRLVVLYPPSDVQLVPDPPFPWLLPSRPDSVPSLSSSSSSLSNKNSSKSTVVEGQQLFRLRCMVGVLGNPKSITFAWPSEQPPPAPGRLSQPTAWSSVLDFTGNLLPSVDNARLVQCQPSNHAGTGPLAQVRLVIYGIPAVSVVVLPSGQLVESAQRVEVREGSPLSFRCQASVSGATPQPQTFIWRRDGILLSTQSRDLAIPSVASTHAGRYQCEVAIDTHTSSIGILTSSISFRLSVVFINLTIDAVRRSDVVGEGDNVTLVCRADGHPIRDISFDPWLFEPSFSSSGEQLPSSRSISGNIQLFQKDFGAKDDGDGHEYSNVLHEEQLHLPEMTLQLVNVQPSDSGKYWCSATNQVLLTRRRYFSLDVHFKPRLNAALSSPLSMSVRIGQPMLLTAALTANPAPDEFEWLRLTGQFQRPDALPSSWSTERVSPTAFQLHIPALTPSDLYDGPLNIAIRARNSRGQSTFQFTLIARGPPLNPTGLRVIRSWPNSLLLTFQPGFDGGQPQVFRTECVMATRDEQRNTKQNNNENNNNNNVVVFVRDPGYGRAARVVVRNLKAATEYECSVEGLVNVWGNDTDAMPKLVMPTTESTASHWRTSKIFVTAQTVNTPLINVTSVEWAKVASSNASSMVHDRPAKSHSVLRRVCFTVSCASHPLECNSQGSLVVEAKGASRSLQTNVAGMRFATELTICLSKKHRLMKGKQRPLLPLSVSDNNHNNNNNKVDFGDTWCWTSSKNHSIEVWEQPSSYSQNSTVRNDLLEKSPQLCFAYALGQASSNSSSSSLFANDELLPRIESPVVVVSIRLFSIMDGELVSSLTNVTLKIPSLLKASGSRVFIDDSDYLADEDASSENSLLSGDGMLWPLMGTVLGLVLVIGFVGFVAVTACSQSRRAATASSCRRISLSTGASSDSSASTANNRANGGVYMLSSSPSSSFENAMKENSTNNGSIVRKNNGERLTMMTFASSTTTTATGGSGGSMTSTSGGSDSQHRRRSGDTVSSRNKAADFHWADFRANPLLASIGVASTLTSVATRQNARILRSDREERVISCVNGINNAQLFGGSDTGGVAGGESIRQLMKHQTIDAIASTAPSNFSDATDLTNNSNSDDYQCVNGFELQEQCRLTSSMLSSSSVEKATAADHSHQHKIISGISCNDLECDLISPPPRYTTLYSRLADLKRPVERPTIQPGTNGNGNLSPYVPPTQYARLDFIKMAHNTSNNKSEKHSSSSTPIIAAAHQQQGRARTRGRDDAGKVKYSHR